MAKTDKLHALALEASAIQARFETAARNYIRTARPAVKMTDEVFWALVGRLVGEIAQFQKRHGGDAVKHACDELVRYECFNQVTTFGRPMLDESAEADITSKAWEKMALFARRYGELVAKLHHKLSDLPGLERGDDGFGDLCDSLPLAGAEVIKAIFNGDVANYEQLAAAVSLPGTGLKRPIPFILEGENYVRMMLDEALIFHLPSVARRGQKGGE